jgi:hypothetical protein
MGPSAKIDATQGDAPRDSDGETQGLNAAQRVLRARRRREEPKKQRSWRFPALILGAFVVVGGAGVAILNGTSVGRTQPELVVQSAQPVQVGEAPAPADIEIADAEETGTRVQSDVQRPESAGDDSGAHDTPQVRVRVLSREEALAISGGAWGHGVRVANAVAGNALGVGGGDIIVDLCDRPGVQTATEIVAALGDGTTTCVETLGAR